MFRRAPRTFSARRRPASSGSSSSEEEPGAEPAPAPPQDPGTAAAERPQPSERPVRSRAGVLSFGSEEEREGEGRRAGGFSALLGTAAVASWWGVVGRP